MIKDSEVFGKGIRYHNPSKVLPNGQYGYLLIDLNKIYGQNKFIAKNQRTGKEVINVMIDHDLIHLINKRYNNNKKHSILSTKSI